MRRLGVDVAHDGDIELDDVRRQLEDVPEAREPRAGVIHRDACTGPAQRLERVAEPRIVARRSVLGELDDHALEGPPPQRIDELG